MTKKKENVWTLLDDFVANPNLVTLYRTAARPASELWDTAPTGKRQDFVTNPDLAVGIMIGAFSVISALVRSGCPVPEGSAGLVQKMIGFIKDATNQAHLRGYLPEERPRGRKPASHKTGRKKK